MTLALASGGCPERRQPLRVHGDAGPAVVVVDPVKRNPTALPPVALVDESEPDDDLAHAQPMEPGKGVRGTIGAPQPGKGPKGKAKPDADVYSWLEPGSAPDGGFNEARVELTGVAGLDLSLEVLSGDGERLWIANDNGAGEPEVAPNVAFEPGHTYYLRVRAQGEQSDPAHAYELVIRSAQAIAGAEREPNDDAARATQLPSLADANGFYGRRRDEDWLKLPTLPALGGAPPILRLELGPVEGVAPELKVLVGSAVLAAARAGRGEELRLRNVGLPAVENVLVMLKAAEGKNYLDRWTLKLAVEPPLDGAEREPNDTIEHANAIALDGAQPVAGFLWPGDVDLYRVTGAADALFTAEVDGVERVDLKLDRLSADGKQLARADDNGVGQGERLPPWPVGAGAGAILRVTARARDTAFDAPYRLTIAAAPPDAELEREPNDARESATPWREGARTMHGYLAPRGDVDVYKFVAPAGKAQATAAIDAPGSSLKIAISGEAGLPSAPPDQPGRATCALTAGKTYFVTVKGATEKTSNAREPYTITLTFD